MKTSKLLGGVAGGWNESKILSGGSTLKKILLNKIVNRSYFYRSK